MSEPITMESLRSNVAAGPASRRAAAHRAKECHDVEGSCRYWLWFLVIALVVGVILAVARPKFVRKCGEEERSRSEKCDRECDDFFRDINWGKLVLWALVIALIICVVLYLLKHCGCFDGCETACSR